MQLNREQLAYTGGLFEGEGSLNARGCKLWVQIRMTDREPLDEVHKATHLGKIDGPYPQPAPKKDLWVWRISCFEEAQAFVAMIWPWLSPRRKEQARQMLAQVAASVVRPDRVRRVRRHVRRKCEATCCQP